MELIVGEIDEVGGEPIVADEFDGGAGFDFGFFGGGRGPAEDLAEGEGERCGGIGDGPEDLLFGGIEFLEGAVEASAVGEVEELTEFVLGGGIGSGAIDDQAVTALDDHGTAPNDAAAAGWDLDLDLGLGWGLGLGLGVEREDGEGEGEGELGEGDHRS